MKALILLAVILTSSAHLESADRSNNSLQHELLLYRAQIRILYQLLERDCPSHAALEKNRRQTDFDTKLEVQKIHYERLVNQLTSCRKEEVNKKLSE